jgi:hypothetical protein
MKRAELGLVTDASQHRRFCAKSVKNQCFALFICEADNNVI